MADDGRDARAGREGALCRGRAPHAPWLADGRAVHHRAVPRRALPRHSVPGRAVLIARHAGAPMSPRRAGAR
jgi:hypothetical protein